MPRKNARPAAKKKELRRKAQLVAQAHYDRKAVVYLKEPHHGDQRILAALALSILSEKPVTERQE